MTIDSDAQLNKEMLVAFGELAALGMLNANDDTWALNDKGRAKARQIIAERLPDMADQVLVILLTGEGFNARN
jgi:hypothetical protein